MNDVIWLLRFARPASAALAGSIAARILGHVLGAAVLAVPAWAIGVIATGGVADAATEAAADAATGFASGRFAAATLAVIVAMSLVKAVSRYAEQFLGHFAAFQLMGEMRVWIIDRLIPQAPAVTDGVGAARLHATAVRDVGRVEVFFAHTIAPAVTAVVIPVASVAVAYALAGWAPAAVLAVVMIIGVGVAFVGARAGRAAARDVVATRGEIAGHVADTVRLREDVLAHEATATRLDQAARLDEELASHVRGSGRAAGIRHGAGGARVWLGTIAVFLAAVPSLAADATGLPGALAAMALVAGTAASLDSIERLAGSLPAGLEATHRIRVLAGTSPSVPEPERPAAIPAAHSPATIPAAELAHVTFAYPGAGGPTVEDVSVVKHRGGFIGVAGATGSGKSTIARLLQRHWDPDAGTVTIGGVDAHDAGSAQVFAHIAVADQDPFLVDGTLADNLRMGGADADDELVRRALHIADLDAAELTSGPIGRRGSRLSGGQKQRLALARTFIRAASAPGGLGNAVLVLDEATSHQDPLTQRRIIGRLRESGVTMLVIAHRLATLRDADDILVIDHGRIVEHGTYARLADADGHFAALLAAQE